MFSVGLDVDKLVFTEKILLYAGNSYITININSPLVFITLGKIYLFKRQSAGNFGFSTKATAVTKNTYTNYKFLPLISEHVPNHKSNLTDDEFGYFLAGLIEGDGWFGNKELHIIFAEEDTSLAYYIKKRIEHGNVYKIKDKKAVRYICKNTNGLSLILSLINGKLVSYYKYDQLIKHNYSEIFNINILPPLKTVSLDNYWLAGFTQAAVPGCFHISVAKSNTMKTGYSVRLEYSLKQNDKLPLKLLIDTLKMGNLTQYSTGV
jgi:LAGLIDADG endonuclease